MAREPFSDSVRSGAEFEASVQAWAKSQIPGTNGFVCEINSKHNDHFLGLLAITLEGDGFLSIPLDSKYKPDSQLNRFNNFAACQNNKSFGLNGGHNESHAFKQVGLEIHHSYSDERYIIRTGISTREDMNGEYSGLIIRIKKIEEPEGPEKPKEKAVETEEEKDRKRVKLALEIATGIEDALGAFKINPHNPIPQDFTEFDSKNFYSI